MRVNVLIINNDGRFEDAGLLRSTFEKLGWGVSVMAGLSCAQMLAAIAEGVGHPESAFVLVTLSDGNAACLKADMLIPRVTVANALSEDSPRPRPKVVIFDGPRSSECLAVPRCSSQRKLYLHRHRNTILATSTHNFGDSHESGGRSWFLAALCGRLLRGGGKLFSDVLEEARQDVAHAAFQNATVQYPDVIRLGVQDEIVVPERI